MTTAIDGPPSSLPTLRFMESLTLERSVQIFGLRVTDASFAEAARLLDALIRRRDRAKSVHFVNAHTLNQANRSAEYSHVLARAEHLFGDGAGVRLAARMLHGVQLRANLNGTDLVPYFMKERPGEGRRVFMLGTKEETLRRAVREVENTMAGWQVCGSQHGYFRGPAEEARVIGQINRSRADLLLVAMGNPRQEIWIDRHARRLEVPLAMGVGALFDYWGGAERRAPLWMRRASLEWLYRMLWQRGKLGRYLLGNPQFLFELARAKWTAR